MKRLEALLACRSDNLPRFMRGYVPRHFKRLSVPLEKAYELAIDGDAVIGGAFDDVDLYFCQALIAGAILSPDFDTITIVTPSQYGKAIEKHVPVLTKNGWKIHGDLAVGDEVLSLDGEWVKVTYVHPDCEMDRKITLENGDSFICHHNHEWVLTTGIFDTDTIERHPGRHEIPMSETETVAIESIEPVSGYIGNCITVEGGIYRIGRHLVPTHNSWLLGRVALYMAYIGRPLYLAGATQDTTDIIMRHVVQAAQTASPEIRNAFQGQSLDRLDKLTKSLSKTRLSAGEGFVESVTLGDTYSGQVSRNKAVGRGGDYIIDEAALCSEDALAEIGRREFASTDGEVYKLIMISNPHTAGFFYDHLTEDHPGERDFILWIDALTAVEEGRFTAKQVLESDFAKHQSTRVRYLLCELDSNGLGMFPAPVVENPPEGDKKYFVGVDAAYKGKDNIELALVSTCDGKVHVEEIETIEKKHWIDGKTSEDIIMAVSAVVGAYKVSMVCNDIGYGVWLTEGLARRSVNVRGINFGAGPTKERVQAKHYAAIEAQNMRAEMHIDLQDLMSNGLLTWSPDCAKKVKDVLPAITSERRTNGKIQIRPKSEIKALIGKSPDEFDAVLLAVHAAILASGIDNAYIL